jgi:hypothetical protein
MLPARAICRKCDGEARRVSDSCGHVARDPEVHNGVPAGAVGHRANRKPTPRVTYRLESLNASSKSGPAKWGARSPSQDAPRRRSRVFVSRSPDVYMID